MRKQSRKLAYCAMTAALSVVVMAITGVTGMGTYIGPLLAALLIVPVEAFYGWGSALCVWLVSGLTALLLVTDRELAVVYLTIFGWYPAVRPRLMKLPGMLSFAVRLLLFNGAVVVSYAAMVRLIMGVGESLGGPVMMAALLLMGNLVFLMEDMVLIPRVIPLLQKRIGKWWTTK